MIDWNWQTLIAAAALLGGAVAYLIRIERVLTHLSTTVANFCKESAEDRKTIWEHITKIKDDFAGHGERLTRTETKLETHGHQTRRNTA